MDSLNDCVIEDNFINDIKKDLDLDLEIPNPNSLNISNNSDDENLDQHIQSNIYPKKDSFFPTLTEDEKIELDSRSIYVGNVDYSSTAKELECHFNGCGAVNKITILTNKYTGHPKGFAYIEFEMAEAVDTAMALDESEFKGRPLKVMPKRTNIPGISTTNRPPRRGRRIGGPRTSRYRRNYTSGYAPY